MTLAFESAPYVALVDDDSHSARLLERMLTAHGAPEIEWFGGAEQSRAHLEARLADRDAVWPSMLIVDLKARSSATRDFIAGIAGMIKETGLLVAAIVPTPSREDRDRLLAAGATGVFERHADRDAYRQEAARIVSFWARGQRLDAVGM